MTIISALPLSILLVEDDLLMRLGLRQTVQWYLERRDWWEPLLAKR